MHQRMVPTSRPCLPSSASDGWLPGMEPQWARGFAPRGRCATAADGVVRQREPGRGHGTLFEPFAAGAVDLKTSRRAIGKLME